jgi:very-short-patch-repair endonuclease
MIGLVMKLLSRAGRGIQGEGGEKKMLNDPPQRSRRRLLRRRMTAAERTMWSKLRGNRLHGHRFHRQTSIDNYIADFYCSEKKLVLEIDGSIHLFYEKGESDLKRQQYLEQLGFKVLRFTNEEVKNSIEVVLQRIPTALKES